MESKLAIANILKRYTILPSEKTEEPLILDPTSNFTFAKGGIHVKVTKRE